MRIFGMRASRAPLTSLISMLVGTPAFLFGVGFGLPSATKGQPYSYSIGHEGGGGTLHWKVIAGELPPGILLSDKGEIKGQPTLERKEPYGFTVQVSDSSEPPQLAVQDFILLIRPAPLRILLTTSPLSFVLPTTGSSGDPTGSGDVPREVPTPSPVPSPVPSASLVAPPQPADAKDGPPTTPILGDWGRAQAYFSGGGIFSKENGDFSKQDMYLGFTLDKNWRQPVLLSSTKVQSSGLPGAEKTQSKDSWPKRFYVNSYFDTRLTSIPVAPGAGEGTPTTTADGLDQFLQSKKAALMQAGIYIPWVLTRWKFEGADNGFFVGPIGKGGFQSVTGEGSSAEAARFGGDDLFNFFAIGARIGHYKLNDNRDRAPELVSYLDITRGRWENFGLLGCKSATGDVTFKPSCQGSSGVLPIQMRPWRWGLEGRLKIPGAPLQIGFDANGGLGRDDLRFLFGTNFNVGDLFAKLKLPTPKTE